MSTTTKRTTKRSKATDGADEAAEVKSYGTPEDIFGLEEAEDAPDDGNTVYVLNISGAEFHVPLPSSDPKLYSQEDEIVFETNEAKKFDKNDIVLNKRFKRCVELKFLKLITKEEYTAHVKKAKRLAKKTDGKSSAGRYAASGLPADWKRAVRDIGEMDDIDELEKYSDMEDREIVLNAIDARIDELEEA